MLISVWNDSLLSILPFLPLFLIILLICEVLDIVSKERFARIFIEIQNAINKSTKISWILLIFALLYGFFSLLLMNFGNSSYPTQGDYSILYYLSWSLDYTGSTYSIDLNAGFDFFETPHPSINFFLYLLNLVHIPLLFSFRALIILAVMLSFYVPYDLARRNKIPPFESIFAGLWSMAGTYLFIVPFEEGNLPFYFSQIFAIYGAYYLNQLLEEDPISRKKAIVLSALFFGLAISTHFLSVLTIGFLSVYLLLKKSHRIFGKDHKQNLRNLFWVVILAGIVASMFLIPYLDRMIIHGLITAVLDLPLQYQTKTIVDALTLGFIYINLSYMSVLIVIVTIFSIILFLKKKHRPIFMKVLLSSYFVYFVYLLVEALLSYLVDAKFTLNLPFRYLVFVEMTLGLFFAFVLRSWNNYLKQNKRTLRVTLVMFLILLPLGTNLLRFHNLDLIQMPSSTKDTIDWINAHPLNKTSRYLLENSDFATNQVWGGPSITSLFPIYTEEYFIGEVGSFFWVSKNSSFYDGLAFGKPIEQYSLEEFEQKLRDLNVRYLIVHTNETKHFLTQYNMTFSLIQVIDLFFFYEYKNAINSYIQLSDLNANAQLITFTDTDICFNVTDIKKGSTVQFSLNYISDWQIFLNASQVQQNLASSFMNFTVPEDGNYVVTLKWTGSAKDALMFVPSIIAIAYILGFVFKTRYRHRAQAQIDEPDGKAELL